MKVTAVFQCTRKDEQPYGVELAFTPPYSVDRKQGAPHQEGDPERWQRVNDEWSQATPSGELRMTITNPTAAAAFERGKIYLLTFEPFPFEQHGA